MPKEKDVSPVDVPRIAKEARLAAGMTQKKAADAASVSTSYLQQIESGKKTPSPEVAESLEDALGLERGALSAPKWLEKTKALEKELEKTKAELAAALSRAPSDGKEGTYVGTVAKKTETENGTWYAPLAEEFRMDPRTEAKTAIIGGSREDREALVARLVIGAARRVRQGGKKDGIVVFDDGKSMRPLAGFVEAGRFRFCSTGNAYFYPINFNPCKIPKGVDPQRWIDCVVDVYCRAHGLRERDGRTLSGAFYRLYEDARVFEERDASKFPSEADWRAEISRRSGQVTFHKIYKHMELRNPLSARGKKFGDDTADAYAGMLERLSCFSRPYSIEYRLFSAETNFEDINAHGTGAAIDELAAFAPGRVTLIETAGTESAFLRFVEGLFAAYAFGVVGETDAEKPIVVASPRGVSTMAETIAEAGRSTRWIAPMPEGSRFAEIVEAESTSTFRGTMERAVFEQTKGRDGTRAAARTSFPTGWADDVSDAEIGLKATAAAEGREPGNGRKNEPDANDGEAGAPKSDAWENEARRLCWTILRAGKEGVTGKTEAEWAGMDLGSALKAATKSAKETMAEFAKTSAALVTARAEIAEVSKRAAEKEEDARGVVETLEKKVEELEKKSAGSASFESGDADGEKETPARLGTGGVAAAAETADARGDAAAEAVARSLSDPQKILVRVMGETGKSELDAILETAKEAFPEFEPEPRSGLRVSMSALMAETEKTKPIVAATKASIPGNVNFRAYELTKEGRETYERLFSKPPVESEAETIRAAHGTIEHGYGVREVAKLLTKAPFVENLGAEVVWLARSKGLSVETGPNGAYVPDVAIRYEKGGEQVERYVEYETGKRSDADFFAKCSKIAGCCGYVDMIVPGLEAKEEVGRKIGRWSDALATGALPFPGRGAVVVRVATYHELRDAVRDGTAKSGIPWSLVKTIARPRRGTG